MPLLWILLRTSVASLLSVQHRSSRRRWVLFTDLSQSGNCKLVTDTRFQGRRISFLTLNMQNQPTEVHVPGFS